MKRMKMKFLIFTAIAIALAYPVYGQPCDCERNFEWLRKTFEENDAGFQHIIDKRGQAAYEIHNQQILERIRNATTLTECVSIMNEWTRFFRIGHIAVRQLINEPAIYQSVPEWQQAISYLNPYLERLNETTLYLRIPSFVIGQKQAIDSVLAVNREKILTTKNLIIDLRDNDGGSDASFEKLLPFLYTNPIRTVGMEFLSTPYNNQLFLIAAEIPEFGEEQREMFLNFYNTLEGRLGEFVLFEEEVAIMQLDTVYVFPKNVGIIINERVASTTEQFLLAAKQSKKVKLFGVTTLGALDISNMNHIISPCGRFALGYGISRSLRIPGMAIDDIGLQPDFFIDRTIPQDRWVEFVNDILNQ